jgi:hypothetical protein
MRKFDASSPEAPHHTSHVLATLNEIGAPVAAEIATAAAR